MPSLVFVAAATALLVRAIVVGPGDRAAVRGLGWWAVTLAMHAPWLVIMCFLAGGVVERLGYFWKGRAPERPGVLPATFPTVCVQLPMFNEHAVAERVIAAASAMTWPHDRLTVQVLDDSTDDDTRSLVDAVCARVRATTGVDCRAVRRADRSGFKAGALEAGRAQTGAEYLVIFDADFLPPRDYLLRTIPHFYRADGTADEGLALVQTQWGHLNHDQSALTRAQSLWVDDHHTVQMSWRSAMWGFVNFTGTAGVWRASAIEEVGGWRAASLVEDCELSFRHLFAGYRTKFVKEIVAPAELPATYTAYKAQQRRWTQGWVQLQRMHLATLLFEYRCSTIRRLHLIYHMCISWQWLAWGVWITLLPFLIHRDLWFGSFGTGVGLVMYVLPSAIWIVLATTVASFETRHTYAEPVGLATLRRRLGRLVPYLVINTGMLPHQFSAFTEGLFGPFHSEFERTPKVATVTTPQAAPAAPVDRADRFRASERSTATLPATQSPPRHHVVRIHWPYVAAELFFVAYQVAWAVVFIAGGLVWCALGALYMASCVTYLAYFYGDHAGRVCFVIDRSRSTGSTDVDPVVDTLPAVPGDRVPVAAWATPRLSPPMVPVDGLLSVPITDTPAQFSTN